MTNVFQTPWLLLSAALVVLAIVAIIRQAVPDKQRWWQLAIPVVIAIVALGLDYFVKTDYEKIKAVLKKVRNAAVAEDADLLGTTLAPNYSDRAHRSREALVSFLRSFFQGTQISKAPQTTWEPPVISQEGTADVAATYRVHLEPNSTYSQVASMYFVKVKFTLVRTEAGEWLFARTELVEVNHHPFNWGDL